MLKRLELKLHLAVVLPRLTEHRLVPAFRPNICVTVCDRGQQSSTQEQNGASPNSLSILWCMYQIGAIHVVQI